MKIIAIANQKGGVSKTTTTLNLGAGLHRKGKKVLLIDLDTQGDLSANLKTAEGEINLLDVATGKAQMKDIIQTTDSGIDLIPSSGGLVNLEKQITSFDFSALDYDFILIDCPPAMSGNTVAAIRASDGVLIPTTADLYAVKSVKAIARSVSNLDRRLVGIVLTRYNERFNISAQVLSGLEALADELGTKLFDSYIHESVAIRESQLTNSTIFEYAPESVPADDYLKLAKEIMKIIKERF